MLSAGASGMHLNRRIGATMANSTVQTAYTAWAATYDTDRNLTRDLDHQVTGAVLAGWRHRTILEIGCGTGKNTGLLGTMGEWVLGVDFTKEMLAQAQSKQAGPTVAFARADLTRPWPCADASVHLVACNLVLEHIADLDFVFAEAARVLAPGGSFFVSELHPFKQYLGSKATFQRDETRVEIPAFVHHVSDFLDAAARADLALTRFNEWWHEEDAGRPPRLVSFLFSKGGAS
jgi:ubiquinone/menaquinone biosynthesis C-methylase UbiE